MRKTKLVLESRDLGEFAEFKKLKKPPSFIDENGPRKLISELILPNLTFFRSDKLH